MIKLLIVIGYILIGAVLLGLIYYIAATNDDCKDFYEYIRFLDDLDNTDSFIGYSITFAILWPVILVMALVVVPFIYIKYMYDRKWRNNLRKKR